MRIWRAVAVIGLVAGPAYAQVPNINLIPELASKTQEEKDADDVKDKAYRESLKKIPDAKTSSDPWGTVRSTDAPKAAPKAASKTSAKSAAPAKPGVKTGSTTN